MSDKEFGQIAWERYAKAVDYKTFDGKPLPSWELLGDKQKFGWNEAISGVFEDMTHNIKAIDHKYQVSQNWHQVWNEVLDFFQHHAPGTKHSKHSKHHSSNTK